MTNHDDIQKELGNIRGTMETGFRGVHERLDKLNSKVANHEKRMQEVEKKASIGEKIDRRHIDSADKWRDRIYNALFSVAIMGILWVLLATNIVNPPV